MSASLVGSEMCIRDRRPPAFSPESSRSWQRSSPPPAGTGLAGRNLITPVSYTHLTLPTICSV
eukprot:14930465-Alexandrium_andersonii.AAC.1